MKVIVDCDQPIKVQSEGNLKVTPFAEGASLRVNLTTEQLKSVISAVLNVLTSLNAAFPTAVEQEAISFLTNVQSNEFLLNILVLLLNKL